MARTRPSPQKIRETFSADKIRRALEDLTNRILEKVDPRKDDIAIVGIQTRGAILAERLAHALESKTGAALPLGVIDVTLYRDDFATASVQPPGESRLDFDLTDKVVVLVDDVLFTGRTVRAALDEMMDYGRPKRILLAVLVDRGHRELPIQADVAALQIATRADESVDLYVSEIDGKEEIVVREPAR